MNEPNEREFLEVRFNHIAQRLADLYDYRKEDSESIRNRLELIDSRLVALQSRMKFETIGVGGLSAFFVSMMMEILKSN